MNLANKVLSKSSISWSDVQKQLLSGLVQTSGGGSRVGPPSSSASTIQINKPLVRQCTDLLIKHIKNLSQTQVIDQLENLAQASSLMVYKTPSDEDPNTVNAFLNTDDFYFEVCVNLHGEITDVKFSIFSDPAQSSQALKEIFCSWSWDLLYKHIDGIKKYFIIADADQALRAKSFRSLQCLEKDLHTLHQIQLKCVERVVAKSTTSNSHKLIEKLVNQTPVGLYSSSRIGEPMRLFYYLSPLDLIQHFQRANSSLSSKSYFNSTFQIIGDQSISPDQVIDHRLGSYLTISLQSHSSGELFSLPDANLLLIGEHDDERACLELLNPYLNSSFKFEKNPLFAKSGKMKPVSSVSVTGTFVVTFNQPIVMCSSALASLQSQLGVETIRLDSITTSHHNAKSSTSSFYHLLLKNSTEWKKASSGIPSSSFSDVPYSVELPDETQIYYISDTTDTPAMLSNENNPNITSTNTISDPTLNLTGVVVEKLAFTHPQDLVLILETMRKQLLVNELLLSCMRPPQQPQSHSRAPDEHQQRIIELSLIGAFTLCIVMQHPVLLCYTSIELDVSRGAGCVEARFRDHHNLHNPHVIGEIARRCHSIPVTLRALLMKYRRPASPSDQDTLYEDSNNSSSRRHKRNNHQNNNNTSSNNNKRKFNNLSDDEMNGEDGHHMNGHHNHHQNHHSITSTDNRMPLSKKDKKNFDSPSSAASMSKSNLEMKNSNKKQDCNESIVKKSTSDSVSIDLINKNSGQKKRKASSSSSTSSNADIQPSSSSQSPLLVKRTKPDTSLSSNKIDPNKPKLAKSKTNNPDTLVNKLKTDLGENKIKKVSSSESATSLTPNNKLISKKEVLGANNSLNKSSNKNSNSLNKSLPTSSTGKIKPIATTTPTNSKQSSSSSSSSQIMNQKTKLNEDLKTKAMKDQANKSRHSSFSGSANTSRLNLSATELQLKQQNSPLNLQNSLGNISIESGASSTIKQLGSNRTPSPSPLSLSMSSLLSNSTQSPQQGGESDETALPKYEPTLKSKKPASLSSQPPNLTNKPSSAPLQPTAQAATTKTQSQTPPLLTSLGLLGTKSSLSNFKIPHKPKKTEEASQKAAVITTDSDDPTPLSSSSPIVSNTRSDSPNKDKANKVNQQSSLNRPGSANNSNKTKPSISTSSNNNGRLGNGSASNGSNNMSSSSPKWQGGNVSPRYESSSSSNNNTSPSSTSFVSKLASSSSRLNQIINKLNPLNSRASQPASNSAKTNPTNRLVSPISSNSTSKSSFAATRGPLIPSPTPLMSLTSKMTAASTPASPPAAPMSPPTSQIDHTQITTKLISLNQNHRENVVLNEPEEPASPQTESAPLVAPKLIPLERNNPAEPSNRRVLESAADIASLDVSMNRTSSSMQEEDDENLVIDDYSSTTARASGTLIDSSLKN